MSGSWLPPDFPNLDSEQHEITSRPTRQYNCVAWAAGDDQRWWWPDPFGIGYWPLLPRLATLESFAMAFATLGYDPCLDGGLVARQEKVAIYATRVGDELRPSHVARQLPDGSWTSKLGSFEDIRHTTLEALNGPLYGAPAIYLSRPRP